MLTQAHEIMTEIVVFIADLSVPALARHNQTAQLFTPVLPGHETVSISMTLLRPFTVLIRRCLCSDACPHCKHTEAMEHLMQDRQDGWHPCWQDFTDADISDCVDTGKAKWQMPLRQSRTRQGRQRSNGRADWERSKLTGRASWLKGRLNGLRIGQLQSRLGGKPKGRLSSSGSSS